MPRHRFVPAVDPLEGRAPASFVPLNGPPPAAQPMGSPAPPETLTVTYADPADDEARWEVDTYADGFRHSLDDGRSRRPRGTSAVVATAMMIRS
jgi:hypothetical protein